MLVPHRALFITRRLVVRGWRRGPRRAPDRQGLLDEAHAFRRRCVAGVHGHAEFLALALDAHSLIVRHAAQIVLDQEAHELGKEDVVEKLRRVERRKVPLHVVAREIERGEKRVLDVHGIQDLVQEFPAALAVVAT